MNDVFVFEFYASSVFKYMKKVYSEIGSGNESFLSTEVESVDGEYRIPKFILPKKIQEVYFRLWFFKKVLVISVHKGIKVENKDRNKLKILFGIGGRR